MIEKIALHFLKSKKLFIICKVTNVNYVGEKRELSLIKCTWKRLIKSRNRNRFASLKSKVHVSFSFSISGTHIYYDYDVH